MTAVRSDPTYALAVNEAGTLLVGVALRLAEAKRTLGRDAWLEFRSSLGLPAAMVSALVWLGLEWDRLSGDEQLQACRDMLVTGAKTAARSVNKTRLEVPRAG